MRYIITASGVAVPVVYAVEMPNKAIFWTPNVKKATKFSKTKARKVAADARRTELNVKVWEVAT